MFFDEIEEKYIYYVQFNPVKQCEFNDQHLAIVLKKNKDKKTVIVVPLTTSNRGEGVGKVNIGKIATLPDNLNNRDSYLVYNQIRTVNYVRFVELIYDNPIQKGAELDDDLFKKVLNYCSEELISILSFDEKVDFYYNLYINSIIQNVIDTAYNIKKSVNNNESIYDLEKKLNKLLETNVDYEKYLKPIDYENGISDIIKSCKRFRFIKILKLLLKQDKSA